LQTAREEERTAMARELHDDLAQTLVAAKMDVRQMERKIVSVVEEEGASAAAVLADLDKFAKMIDNSIRSIRALVTELRLELLDEAGLRAAAEWQVEKFAERTGILCRFRSN